MGLQRRGTLLCLFLLLAAVTPALAQTGALRVRVLDGQNQQPLPGATALLTNAQQLVAPTALLTDADGVAEFPVLRSGSGYALDVSMPGYSGQRLSDLRISSDDTERLTVQLGPELREQVRVSAERGVVELEKVESSTKFTGEFIQNLPILGRFYQNVLTLAPGVVDPDGDGNPNVHGARSRDFRAEVSGVSNADPLTGQWMSFVNPESIEELDVITSGAGAEFGRAQGGFSRVVQKQGSNDFEGVFGFIYRSSRLDSQAAAGFFRTESTDFHWYQPSLQFSGPIIKDRLWFRASHEYIEREDPFNMLTRFVVITRTQSINADQITWQVSPRNKLAFQFQSDPLTIENFGATTRIPPESSQKLERGGSTYSLIWTAPLSARLLVENQVAWQDHEENVLPMSPEAQQDCVTFFRFASMNGANCLNLDTGLTSGAYFESSRDHRQRLTVRSQTVLFVPRLLGASHRFKFGLVVENERYFRSLERKGDMQFSSVATPFDPNFDRLGFATVRLSVPQTSSGRARGMNWAVYFEDQLKPLSSMAITLGLRVDREEIHARGYDNIDPAAEVAAFNAQLPQCRASFNVAPCFQQNFTAYPDIADFTNTLAGQLGILPQFVHLGAGAASSASWYKWRRPDDMNLTNTNISPRLSVAWDPWRDGKTKLALSSGRYYDKIFLAVPLLEIEPPSTTMTFLALPFGPTGQFFEVFINEGINPSLSVQMVDRNLKTPYQDELTFGIERSLWPETSIKLSYVRRDFKDQLQDRDINHQVGDFGRCVRADSVGASAVIPSPGRGQTIIDPYGGPSHVDTDLGPGDGVLDDCTGNLERVGGVLGFDRQMPDGLADLYVQNPGWGELLLVGNFNTTEYRAYVLELVRRQYRGWELSGSYTWSKAEGDAEDFNQLLGNERNLLEDEHGFLSYDQRHSAKVNATTITPWGLRLGGSLRWESGLAYSILSSKQTLLSIPPDYGGIGDHDVRLRLRYPSRQRNDQRNPSFWTFDLRVAKEVPLPGKTQLQLTAEVFNVFDDDTLRLDDRINGTNGGERRFGRHFQMGMRLGF